MEGDPGKVDDVIRLLGDLREAWQQIAAAPRAAAAATWPLAAPAVAPYLALLSLTRCERDLIAANDWEGGGHARGTDTHRWWRRSRPRPGPRPRSSSPRRSRSYRRTSQRRSQPVRPPHATLSHLAEGRRALHAYAGTREGGSVDARS